MNHYEFGHVFSYYYQIIFLDENDEEYEDGEWTLTKYLTDNSFMINPKYSKTHNLKKINSPSQSTNNKNNKPHFKDKFY